MYIVFGSKKNVYKSVPMKGIEVIEKYNYKNIDECTKLMNEKSKITGSHYSKSIKHPVIRMNINSRITAYGDIPISELTSQQTLETFFDPNSITFDDSSGKNIKGGTDVSARMSDSAVDTTGHVLPNGADILPGRVLVAHRFDEDWFRDSPYATTISI